MNLSATLLDGNNALAAMSKQAGNKVTKAIYNASASTGIDFGYLMQQAKVESSFDVDAQAKTSSARGLYQFINSTWLDMVDRHGEKYGIDDDLSRKEILKLRDNPEISAKMAAEFASDNKKSLERNWGGNVGATELYLAHFLGAGGAASFLKAKDANPLQPAAELFERAASANRNLFYDSTTKRAKTLQEVYEHFDKKFEDIKSPVNIEIADAGKNNLQSDDCIVPLHSFSERFEALAERKTENKDLLSLFSNVPQNKKWLQLSSVDFIALLKTN